MNIKTNNIEENLITTCYYDRNPENIEGLFTIRTIDKVSNKVVKEITKLSARSGQRGETKSSWKRGSSPIPWTQESKVTYIQSFINEFPKEYWLWLRDVKQKGQWAGKTGIGEFRAISTSKTDPGTIVSPTKPHLVRKYVGLHPENNYFGSLGCIVLLSDTEEQKNRVLALRQYLEELAKTQKHIRLVVI